LYPSKRHYPPSSKKSATPKERIIGTIAAISLAAAVAAFPLILLVLILLVLLLFVYLLTPLSIPLPPFRSPLVRALQRARREEAAAQITRGVRAPIRIRELPEFFPLGSKVEDAEKLLLKEGFKPGAVGSLEAKEATAWGVQACRLHEYSRLTHVHPLWSNLWEIYLFVDGNGSICAFRARPCIAPYAQMPGVFRRPARPAGCSKHTAT
jgi:hypothetical protein